jgi:hypothetical protein
VSQLPARWGIRDGRPSPRDAALLAEVVQAAHGQLATLPEGAPAVPEAEEGVSVQVRQLITAALTELHRHEAYQPPPGAAAPVLGEGVVPELLRRRQPANAPVDPAEHLIDTRR